MAKLMFNKSHEWLLVEGETGKLGISEHAQNELGDLVFIELPQEGDTLTIGQSFMNVESVKAVSELYSPVDGKVIAINEELESSPELVNQSAMDTWIVEVSISKISDQLMTEEEYKEYISNN